MKTLYSLIVSAAVLQGLPGICSESNSSTAASAASQPAASGWSGKVTETMNAGGYTYVQIDTGKEKVWVAAPQCTVKVGEKVTVPGGMPMKDYHSKTLNRTFPTIYFASAIETPASGHAAANATPSNPHAGVAGMGAPSAAAPTDFSGLKKAEGGQTVAGVYADKKALQNKTVRVRGKVVKYHAQIMNRNWLHLQDGTGAAGANDLTVTTTDTAKVGDTVLVTGTLVLDKDFGYGYKYNVLLENAKVTVEAPAKQ